MPLSAVEIADCDRFALRVIREDVGIELAEYYAAAVFHGNNEKPEQPNNEIRNALNHISRAYAAEDMQAANTELEAAERHMVRAKRDALKLAIIGLFDQIKFILRNAEAYYGSIAPALVLKRRSLTSARADAYISESKGNSGSTEALQQIYIDSIDFLQKLEDEYPSVSGEKKAFLLFFKLRRALFSGFIGFVLGVLASLAASWLWVKYFIGE